MQTDSPARTLYRLQSVDRKVDQATQRLAEIERVLGDDSTARALAQAVRAAEDGLKPLQAQARQLEHELAQNASKAKETEDQLYGGKVRNPKALGEMQQELDALARHRATLEERLLGLMLQVDEAQGALAHAETQQQTAAGDQDESHAALRAEHTALTVELDQLQAQRTATAAPLAPDVLRQYQQLRTRRGGIAVAVLDGEQCSACGVEQTRAIIGQVRGGQLVHCMSCGRILVIR